MATLNKIKSVKNTVLTLLEQNESLRDSDDKLIANIWFNEVGKKNPELVVKDFLVLLGQSKLSNPEAITRARRSIQQKNPELRGNNYQGRLKEEINVRKKIHTI
jgi:hypothetical protein